MIGFRAVAAFFVLGLAGTAAGIVGNEARSRGAPRAEKGPVVTLDTVYIVVPVPEPVAARH